jgi:hypothetical protein
VATREFFVVNTARVRWPMPERANAQLMKLPCRKLGLVVIPAKREHKLVYGCEYRRASNSNG